MLDATPEPRRWRDSVILKLMAIGGLMVLLLIPLAKVGWLVAERQSRSESVAHEVAATWGRSQTLAGPVLSVPYTVRWSDEKGKLWSDTRWVHFLPDELRVDGRLLPERRHRGIFETVVYRAEVQLAGAFVRPELGRWQIAERDVLWDQAVLSLGVPDLRGTRQVALRWRGRDLPPEPGRGEAGAWTAGLRVTVPALAAGAQGERYPFDLRLGLNGSDRLLVVPAGKETVVRLQSSWPHPSFTGAFLPVRRTVAEQGFDATWRVSWLGRSYPQQWRSEDAEALAPYDAVTGSAFGVELFLPADGYQKTDRATKYALLFVALTFLTFFLCELFNPFALHPVQYLLVGFALCLFYLLLLSLSEILGFGPAYAVAAAATVLLISGYSAAALHGWRRALVMAGELGLLYGFLWVLLQAEDRSLVLGSVALFLILAVVMYLTRRIDWYAPRPQRVAGGSST
jgi:inner membrane protein